MKSLMLLLTLTALIFAQEITNLQELKSLKTAGWVTVTASVDSLLSGDRYLISDATAKFIIKADTSDAFLHKEVTIRGEFNPNRAVELKSWLISQDDSILYKNYKEYPIQMEGLAPSLENRALYSYYKTSKDQALAKIFMGAMLETFTVVAFVSSVSKLHDNEGGTRAQRMNTDFDIDFTSSGSLGKGGLTIALTTTGAILLGTGIAQRQRAKRALAELEERKRITLSLGFNPFGREMALIGEF